MATARALGVPLSRLFWPDLAGLAWFLSGEGSGARTHDNLIKSQMLCRLSYAPMLFPSIS